MVLVISLPAPAHTVRVITASAQPVLGLLHEELHQPHQPGVALQDPEVEAGARHLEDVVLVEDEVDLERMHPDICVVSPVDNMSDPPSSGPLQGKSTKYCEYESIFLSLTLCPSNPSLPTLECESTKVRLFKNF